MVEAGQDAQDQHFVDLYAEFGTLQQASNENLGPASQKTKSMEDASELRQRN